MHHRLGAGVTEPVDQPQDRRDGRFAPVPGEQAGTVLQHPGELQPPPGLGTADTTAAATVPAGSDGSTPATTSAIRATGSQPSPGGHWWQRGLPSRSRLLTGRVSPQAAHGSRTGPQTPQYQSSPRRCWVRSALPHSAHAGGETAVAPALTSAISKSPTARGAGDRPSGEQRAGDQCLGEPALLGPPSGDPGHHRPDRPAVHARLDARDQGDRDADRVGDRRLPRAGSVTRPGDPGAPRAQAADSSAAACAGPLLVLRGDGNRLDQVRHVQSRMSSSAIRIFRLSRSGRSVTSR